jgi:hypothetical protein
MAKINVRASAYRVARGKAEIARDKKWQQTAKLTTKKSQELKKLEPVGKAIEGSGGRDQDKVPGTEDPEKLDRGKPGEPAGPAAPDITKKRS